MIITPTQDWTAGGGGRPKYVPNTLVTQRANPHLLLKTHEACGFKLGESRGGVWEALAH